MVNPSLERTRPNRYYHIAAHPANAGRMPENSVPAPVVVTLSVSEESQPHKTGIVSFGSAQGKQPSLRSGSPVPAPTSLLPSRIQV